MISRFLVDRVDGIRVEPRAVQGLLLEGRYIVIEPVDYSGHSILEVGATLLDDGSASTSLAGERIGFRRPRLSDAQTDDLAVAHDALSAIDAQSDLAARRWPSPLLPSELGRDTDTTDLERLLDEVFERGHLDRIAISPRVSMRYDTERLPVGRAHRLDSAFQRYLSAHSEDWAARALNGVIPKAVLARVSDDDADTYEHRVYARLLDHLDRYLHRRIARLANIGERYSRALQFQDSERVDYRIRDAICRVWGEAVSGSDASELLAKNDERLGTLRRWSKRIKSLKMKRAQSLGNGSLYAAIPRSAKVELGLLTTNLLSHDAHYRQLRLLWSAWLRATTGERERPVQVLERRSAEQARYERYLGLLLVRALAALGFQIDMADAVQGEASNAHWNEYIQIRFLDHTWSIELRTRRLVLVPVAVALDADLSGRWVTHMFNGGKELRIPCVLQLGQNPVEIAPAARVTDNAPALELTPLDLYAEESLISLLLSWLWLGRLEGYGEKFRHLPKAVVDAWPWSNTTKSNDQSLQRPLDNAQWDTLMLALEQHTRADLRDRIKMRKVQLDHLACCPECGQRADLFEPLDGGFFARCHCGCEWQLRDSYFIQAKRGETKDQTFEAFGRFALRIPVARV